jgi:uncharacterized membrane protein YfcA
MPIVTPSLALIIFVAGVIAGAMGSLLGLAGGVFLVPFLNLGLNFSFPVAAAISLTTVIATSSSVSAVRSREHVINLRLGMLLEVVTAGGSLLGGITAQLIDPAHLQKLFGLTMAAIAATMMTRLNRRNVILDSSVDTGMLGGRYVEQESGGVVCYRVKRLPLAMFASFVAGNVSSLLGIGGGVIKVPVLNAWCGVPLRVAAATSAFMIGVTATPGAIIYYGRGQLIPGLAAAAVLGVQLGSWRALRLAPKVPAKWLKLLMAIVLGIVAILMFVRPR